MCLIDRKRYRFTIFPKIVYKTFIFDRNTYQLKNFFIHDDVTSRILIPSSNDEPEFECGRYKFTKGFIHALQFKCHTETGYHGILKDGTEIWELKCIIPPFTRYAKSENVSICARRMIIIDKLVKHVFN